MTTQPRAPGPPLFSLSRRRWLAAGLAAPLYCAASQDVPTAGRRTLEFPRDFGSHPDTAIEWWYVTGELHAAARRYGFQLTFFRARVPTTQDMRSVFAARQLIFAHAALTDVDGQRLLHDQRLARSSGDASVDLASSSVADTDVRLRDWSLRREGERYLARVSGAGFGLSLTLQTTQPLLLQGEQGWSRKGPQAEQASYYYSVPQLAVTGELTQAGRSMPVTGVAWLDHEWSQSLLDAQAVGWDWIGMNLYDGGALTAFRLRRNDGSTLWAGGSWRARGAPQAIALAADEVVFTPQRRWKSPASGATYPVTWSLKIDWRAPFSEALAGQLTVRALLDDQELDSRASTGAIYWEGLSELLNEQGTAIGRGYLEMTGYASPLELA